VIELPKVNQLVLVQVGESVNVSYAEAFAISVDAP